MKKFSLSVICLALLACTSPKNTPLQDLKYRLNQDFIIIRSVELESYLDNLKKRLFDQDSDKLEVLVVKDSWPYALSFGPRTIVISDSLIKNCSNEAELAFVLFHEYAHLVLKHSEQLPNALNPEEKEARELEADIFAFERIFIAGYALKPAYSAIAKLGHEKIAANSSISADSQKRIAQLEKFQLEVICKKYGSCNDSGNTNSRAFSSLRMTMGR